MSSQEVLWINIGIGVFIALIFLARRSRQREPSRLRLGSTGQSGERGVVKSRSSTKTGARREMVSPEAVDEASAQVRVKNLNVVFNYNGHSWDADEVLGLPAGAPMAMVNEAYQKALRTTQPESHAFLQVAFEAIRKSGR